MQLKHTEIMEPTILEIEPDEIHETLVQLESVVQTVPPELAGQRLDRAAANLFPEYSRSRIQLWIDGGELLVDGQKKRRRDAVVVGMKLNLNPVTESQGDWQHQDIFFPVVYEDEDILVVDKPAGLVVHPGAGNWDGTLLNGLIHKYPGLIEIPRAGIVHRLDKDTTGLMVVAKNLVAQNNLVKQLQARSVTRLYKAIVFGGPTASGKIDEPMGRNPKNRLKMAVVANGKEAITAYRVKQKFNSHKLLELKLETGRTHQIRVHMAHKNWPILGDPLYGGKSRLPKGCSEELRAAIEGFPRQALHAFRLQLNHPKSGELVSWGSPLATDMQAMLEVLKDND
jgi:23S rRNA pseudouridine1911/1915/1917 synthase